MLNWLKFGIAKSALFNLPKLKKQNTEKKEIKIISIDLITSIILPQIDNERF